MRVWIAKFSLYVAAWMVSFGVAAALVGARPQHPLSIILLFLVVKSAAAISLGSFRELWRHTSVEDLLSLAQSSFLAMIGLATALAWAPLDAPPSLALIDGLLSAALIAPIRLAPRIFADVLRPLFHRRRRAIVLAGRPERVELELRRIQRSATPDRVVGLMLDGPALVGARLKRVRVLSSGELERVLARGGVQEVTLVPPASPAFTVRLANLCDVHQLPCRSPASLLALSELDRAPEQLLDRRPNSCQDRVVKGLLAKKRILVTGAGGSIGSELSRQLAKIGPEVLVLADRAENALFHVERSISSDREVGTTIAAHVMDVRDAAQVQRLFARYRPQVILHAAAHKHVPLMERHPAEAVLNNVGGTMTLMDAADGFGAESFVFVSTDKAVRPSSVMGLTKRIGELCIQRAARDSQTRFMTVRFGNVLGSNGSVLPIFVEQVQHGGPVTVTHQNMTRYFMSIGEACHLLLCAAAQGGGGELFVLDMGQPMRIVDLATRVIERAGLQPGEDIAITFCGPRPGEKLTEQLLWSNETRAATPFEGIWSIDTGPLQHDAFDRRIAQLLSTAEAGDDMAVREMLIELTSQPGAPADEQPPRESVNGLMAAAAE